jgi:hypothetical protein
MASEFTLTRTWHGNHLSDCCSLFSLLDWLIRRFSVNGFFCHIESLSSPGFSARSFEKSKKLFARHAGIV